MKSYAEEIKALKGLMENEAELKNVMKYFCDELGNNPTFISQGELVDNSMLKGLLSSSVRQYFGNTSTIANIMTVQAEDENFIHGMCWINGKMTTIIYFEDINIGVIAICESMATNELSYIRFRGVIIPPGKAGSFVGHAPKTLQ